MDKEYRQKSKKHSKKSKKAKKRRRQGTPVEDEIEFSTEDESQTSSNKHHKQPAPLVEYSDVSSDDFSGPEAGEIESEGNGAGAGDGSLSDISLDDTPVQAIDSTSTGPGSMPNNNKNIQNFKTFDKGRLGPIQQEAIRSLTPKRQVPIIKVDSTRNKMTDEMFIESSSSSNQQLQSTSQIEKSKQLELIDGESDIGSDESEMVVRKRAKKKDKKHKKKNKKRRKKKRAKSMSSIETISEEEDPILAGDALTPPQPKASGVYTTGKDPSLTPISPVTPPIRGTPPYLSPTIPSKKRDYAAASPHTPPMPKSSHRRSSSPDLHESRAYYSSKHRSRSDRSRSLGENSVFLLNEI